MPAPVTGSRFLQRASQVDQRRRTMSSSNKSPRSVPVSIESRPANNSELLRSTFRPKPLAQSKSVVDQSLKRIRLFPVQDEKALIVGVDGAKATIDYLRSTSMHGMPVEANKDGYVLNDRKGFVEFANRIFAKYRDKAVEAASGASCDDYTSGSVSLMAHQEVVREYLNMNTPYRGLLLFHGLGSGKTCSSIAIAEAMKRERPVMVMTPASLEKNYLEELKKCGDAIYARTQKWRLIETSNAAYGTSVDDVLTDQANQKTRLFRERMKRRGGVWVPDPVGGLEFEELDTSEQKSLNAQLDEMIRVHYHFEHYNGLKEKPPSPLVALVNAWLEGQGAPNPFSGKTIIIDEAHNLVGAIANSLIISDPKRWKISRKLYEALKAAEDSRIVMLTGTPVVNSPTEVAVAFNILRGNIKTWNIRLKPSERGGPITGDRVKTLLENTGLTDFFAYTPYSGDAKIKITRNPFGFSQVERGRVVKSDSGKIDDKTFERRVLDALEKGGINVQKGGVTMVNNVALPDQKETFEETFINWNAKKGTGYLLNPEMFKRRILGLASHFRSAQESLMPAFDRETDFHVILIDMSDFQLELYEKRRAAERKLKSNSFSSNPANLLDGKTPSSYRVYSRAFCNFVFPEPNIVRPFPKRIGMDEEQDDEQLDEVNDALVAAAELQEEIAKSSPELIDLDDEELKIPGHAEAVKRALLDLEENSSQYLRPQDASAESDLPGLETYSPKFLRILEFLRHAPTDLDSRNTGPSLIYSHFRTLEGIGILSLVLKANGFARFEIKKTERSWELDIHDADRDKPLFALYTGGESVEEKEIIRNVFNGAWELLPATLKSQVEALGSQGDKLKQSICANRGSVVNVRNHYGSVIKAIMITAAGAEGISLKNVRYVHLVEAYWHPVRLEQVIGRARRICSHEELPENERRVEVFLYLMKFAEHQLAPPTGKDGDGPKLSLESRRNDRFHETGPPLTSDQFVYQIALKKAGVTEEINQAIRDAAIDCKLYRGLDGTNKNKCLTFSAKNADQFSFTPDIKDDSDDKNARTNKVRTRLDHVSIPGVGDFLIDGEKNLYEPRSEEQLASLTLPDPVARIVTGPTGTYLEYLDN